MKSFSVQLELLRRQDEEEIDSFSVYCILCSPIGCCICPKGQRSYNCNKTRTQRILSSLQDVVCFFASKGKWPFIPPFQQVKVDQVSRSLFPRSDSFIQNFCKNWFPVTKCYRPPQYLYSDVFGVFTPFKVEESTSIGCIAWVPISEFIKSERNLAPRCKFPKYLYKKGIWQLCPIQSWYGP
uniref:Uncharacterized protein n=1 Tax=Megaselia scalaris TaxID=36166 RepID=T1H2E0_MEGSC